MNSKLHYLQARDIAKNYTADCSIAYAKDHLEALMDTRIVVKPKDMTAEDWKVYKETTDLLDQAIQAIYKITTNKEYETIHTN